MKKFISKNFVLGIISLILIVLAIFYYNKMIELEGALKDANQKIEIINAGQSQEPESGLEVGE